MNRTKILFFCVILVYAVVCFVHIDARLPGTKKSYIALPKIYGGDEEHYLVMVSSLIEDFDLKLRNNYYAAQYSGSYCAGEWWRGKYVDHHSRLYNPVTKEYNYAGSLKEEKLNEYYNGGFIERPHHPPGMPALASIFLWPFAYSKFLESAAILLTMSVSLIGFYLLYKLLLYFYREENKMKCMQTVLFFALGTPLLFYGCSFFKENYVAFFLLSAIYFLFAKNKYFWSGFFISLCFFSKYQMVFVCTPLIFYPLLERKFRGFLKISSTVFAGGMFLLLYNYYMYGSPLLFSQQEYDAALFLKKAAVLMITLAILFSVLFGLNYLCRKFNLINGQRRLRVAFSTFGIIFLLGLLYKSSIFKSIVLNPKYGLFYFSPFLLFPVLELCNSKFWQDKKRAATMIIFLFYLVVIFHKKSIESAIGSAFSFRIGVSILPLLSLPFLHWYIKEKKWLLAKIVFPILISFSIFINVLAPIARIHFWHFPLKAAFKGALIDLTKWHEYKYLNIDLDKAVKEGVIFNPEYGILHPEFYNQPGRFSIEIGRPPVKFKKACLKIKTHLVYKNNYVKVYLFDRRVLYVKGKESEKKVSKSINITKMLKENKTVVLEVELFTNSETSIELFDARIEEIVLCYEEDNSIS